MPGGKAGSVAEIKDGGRGEGREGCGGLVLAVDVIGDAEETGGSEKGG